ncbi:MAG: copper resistance protein CopC [Microlunatus sp.]
MKRRFWLTVVVAVVLFTLYGTSQTAWAHNSLIGTTPSDGAQVEAGPAEVVLTFNEPAISTGTKVLVTGPDGLVTDGAPRLIDNTVRQDLKPGLPAGSYAVEWRVTSADGHPINGSFSFQVKTSSVANESPDPTPTTAAPTAGPDGDDTDNGSGWMWWLGIIPVGLALVLGWRFSRR